MLGADGKAHGALIDSLVRELGLGELGTIKSLGSIQSSFVMNPVKTSVGIPMRGL